MGRRGVTAGEVKLPPRMWRAIESECAARDVTLKKFLLEIVEGHLRELGGWKDVDVVPRFARKRQMWFRDADMDLMQARAAALQVKWTEMVFSCVLHWYQSRTIYDASCRIVLEREVPPQCLAHHAPSIREFYEFWRAAGDPDSLPALATLRANGLARYADRLLIADVLSRNPPDLAYAQAGRLEIASRGENPVGLRISHGFIGDSLANVLGNYQMVIETGRPICIGAFRNDDVFLDDDGCIFVPCAENGEEISQVVVFTAYRAPEELPSK